MHLLRKTPIIYYYKAGKRPLCWTWFLSGSFGSAFLSCTHQCLFSAGWIEDVSQIHPLLNQSGNNENIVQKWSRCSSLTTSCLLGSVAAMIPNKSGSECLVVGSTDKQGELKRTCIGMHPCLLSLVGFRFTFALKVRLLSGRGRPVSMCFHLRELVDLI